MQMAQKNVWLQPYKTNSFYSTMAQINAIFNLPFGWNAVVQLQWRNESSWTSMLKTFDFK